MKLKLPFFILFLLLSVKGYSQAIAYAVPNLAQCSNEVFDLTVQIQSALGNQDPLTHSVTFYNSMADANAGVNAIINPQAYVAQQSETIFFRVKYLVNNSFQVNFFNVSWSPQIVLDEPEDVFACDSYVLPALTTGNYYTAPMGGGTILAPGTAITSTVTIYIYEENVLSNCFDEASFTITIGLVPLNQPEPLTLCDFDGDGMEIFDLTSQVDEIIGSLTNEFIITYHISGSDAETGENPIVDPTAYNGSIQELIFVRVASPDSPGCYNITVQLLMTTPCTDNIISGTVRFDFDNNGCTADDQPAANIGVYNITGNNSYQTFTDANGNYSFPNLPDGTHVVTVVQNDLSFSLTPSAHIISMPGDVGEGRNFCMGVTNTINDVSVTLLPVTQARPGFPAMYSLVYQNLGTAAASGTVSLYFQGALMAYTGSTPAMVQTGNALNFEYTNLLPFQTKVIAINFLIFTPPTVNGGDVLTLVAAITPNGDENATNNASALNQVVVNSYDPNDISVREGAYITLDQAQNAYLNYTIRFQNIGNAEAVNVRIENTLDANLDWSTLQPVASSHAYRIERLGNAVKFIYDNINLPGSQENEPASHGYVSYRIKAKPGIAIGDSMENNAAIYFDFNEPVATNTVTTTVQNTMGVADNVATAFTIYPNPASGSVTLKLKEFASADVTVTDVLGKTVLITQVQQAEANIDITTLNAGMYFMTLTVDGKSATTKLLIK